MRTMTWILNLTILACGVCIAGGAAGAILVEPPSKTVVLPSDGSGITRVALLFDISGMQEGEGRRITEALLDWSIVGVASDRRSEFFLHEVTAAWDAEAVSRRESTVNSKEEALDTWYIEELDYSRIGGFVRFDVKPLLDKWIADTSTNYGVVLATSDVSGQVLTDQLGNARLVIRYGFSKP